MRQSHNIGVITTYISDYIFPRLIQGIDKVFYANGYSIILKNTGNSRQMERICLEDILKKDIDGLIIEPSKSELLCKHTSLYEKMDSFGIPYVFIQGVYEQMAERPHILMDDCQGGYLVTKYLLSLGHRSLLGIFKADDRQGRERHKGYVKALQEAGILYDPDRVIWFHTEDRGSKPFLMTVKLLDRHVPVDGIVCYNDQTAVKMIHTLKKRGIQVPGDISVTGYDNSSMSREEAFNLTTIAPVSYTHLSVPDAVFENIYLGDVNEKPLIDWGGTYVTAFAVSAGVKDEEELAAYVKVINLFQKNQEWVDLWTYGIEGTEM